MDLVFTKMHGLGNDFVVIDDRHAEVDLSPDAVEWLCDRHFGVGADGVILARVSGDSGRFYMHYMNADGTLAEMCGNGARCFAKYLVDHGLVAGDQDAFTIDTLGGPKPIAVARGADGTLERATVDMGEPVLTPALVPVIFDGTAMLDEPLETELGPVIVTALSMGNPHAVVWVDDVDEAPVDTLGPVLEAHPSFPRHTNVEFVQVLAPDAIRMRVWERGVGETLACGTGACASVVAAAVTGRTGRSLSVELPGGDLTVTWDEDGRVRMTGGATEVFTGSIRVPDED